MWLQRTATISLIIFYFYFHCISPWRLWGIDTLGQKSPLSLEGDSDKFKNDRQESPGLIWGVIGKSITENALI